MACIMPSANNNCRLQPPTFELHHLHHPLEQVCDVLVHVHAPTRTPTPSASASASTSISERFLRPCGLARVLGLAPADPGLAHAVGEHALP